MEPVEQRSVDVGTLNGDLRGAAVAPGEQGWDEARAAWNLVADQHPAAVAYVETVDDVSAVIAFARSNGLRVAAQGTGHGAACRGTLDGTILVKTERMDGIEIDAGRRVGRFEAGVIWRDAGNAAGEHGLAAFPGSSPDVGVVGYTTGGGFGWLARRYGLACNNVRAVELVTADGELRRVDADSDPDLFWALRGGGGSFGVITAIEFGLLELPEVFAGSVIYPADERSGEILHALSRVDPKHSRRDHVHRQVPAPAPAAADTRAAPRPAADHPRRLLRGPRVRGRGADRSPARAGRPGHGSVRGDAALAARHRPHGPRGAGAGPRAHRVPGRAAGGGG